MQMPSPGTHWLPLLLIWASTDPILYIFAGTFPTMEADKTQYIHRILVDNNGLHKNNRNIKNVTIYNQAEYMQQYNYP